MFKKYFITGILSIIPVYITYWIIEKVFLLVSVPGKTIILSIIKILNIDYADNGQYFYLLENAAGFILTMLFLITLGLIVSNVIGKKIYTLFEKILSAIPVVNKVYSSIKQIISTFSVSDNNSFKKVVLLEYPKKGLWTMSMVTGESTNKKNEEFYTVFVPTTPNPTSGFMLFVKKEDVIDTKVSVEEGLKIIISGGLIAPNKNNIP